MTAKQVQVRRDSSTNLNAATPADGELAYDTTNDELRIGDGSTAGGIHLPNSKMLQSQSYISGTAGGTADALTLTIAPAPAALVSLQRFVFKASATNATTTPTLQINALTAKTLKKKSSTGKAALLAGDIQNGCIYAAVYDGTDFQIESVDLGGGTGNYQTFTASGTWTKPSGLTGNELVKVQAWGAGASGGSRATTGGSSGGGGGAYVENFFRLSDLGSTETITIGAGGAGVSGNATGNNGGDTTFGSKLTAYGGGAGNNTASGGSGGGSLSAGKQGFLNFTVAATYTAVIQAMSLGTYGGGAPYESYNFTDGATIFAKDFAFNGGGYMGGGTSASANGGSSFNGGGGGGNGISASSASIAGNSVNGGGGGGGTGSTTGTKAGGTSQGGGAGGAGGANSGGNGVAGTAPAGGGGGAVQGGTSGAGGRGEVRVTVI